MLRPPTNARESGYTRVAPFDLMLASGSNESIIFEKVNTFSPPIYSRAFSTPIFLDNSLGSEKPI